MKNAYLPWQSMFKERHDDKTAHPDQGSYPQPGVGEQKSDPHLRYGNVPARFKKQFRLIGSAGQNQDYRHSLESRGKGLFGLMTLPDLVGTTTRSWLALTHRMLNKAVNLADAERRTCP